MHERWSFAANNDIKLMSLHFIIHRDLQDYICNCSTYVALYNGSINHYVQISACRSHDFDSTYVCTWPMLFWQI
jgi:hypothetical protein